MATKNKIMSCLSLIFISGWTMASITGTTQPYNTLKITSNIEGEVVSYEKEIGEITNSNQLILKIDDEKLKIKKELAESNLEKAKIDKSHYERRLERYEELRLNNNISVSDYEDVEYEYLSSKNNIKVQSLNLKDAEDDLKNSNIYGRDGYIVSSRAVEVGDYVKTSSILYELVDIRKLKVEAIVDEDNISNIKIDDIVTVIYKDKKIKGKVIQKGFNMKEGFYAYPVIIEIPNDDNLTLGLTVNVELNEVE